jgi:hypothetical protein
MSGLFWKPLIIYGPKLTSLQDNSEIINGYQDLIRRVKMSCARIVDGFVQVTVEPPCPFIAEQNSKLKHSHRWRYPARDLSS